MSEVAFWTPPGDPPDPDPAPVTPPAPTPPVAPETVFTDPLAGEKVTLPSGGWVLLRDVTKLRSKHQKEVLRAGARAEDAVGGRNEDGTPTESSSIERGWAVTETLIKHLTLDWSLPYPADPDDPTREWTLPGIDPTIIGELTTEDYKAFMEALTPARLVLFPPAPTPDDHDKPDSPTEPASE
jgi:hypothetical protein